MARVIKDCPLCGSHTLEAPQHRPGSHYTAEEDAFVAKCRANGITSKVIARLMGIQTAGAIDYRIKRMLGARSGV